MYVNLVRLLEDRHINGETLGNILNIDGKTARNKLQGKNDFKLGEFLKIMKLLPEYSFEYLSKWEGPAVEEED